MASDHQVAAGGAAHDGVLEKVRALLAKAESTTFEAEAEALMAKAQELMTRHRIDRARLAAEAPGEVVGSLRLTMPAPYASAKALLLGAVARANGGQVIWDSSSNEAIVFAFPDDLEAIDELFTSLLVQATAALQREGSRHDHRGRNRTKRFRRSFLTAFATRIGQRLEEVAGAAIADADDGQLLPVLASRDEQVSDALEREFPSSRRMRTSVSDAEGWQAGTREGDAANLSVGRRIPRAS